MSEEPGDTQRVAQFTANQEPPSTTVITLGSNSVKRKRGRPRLYARDELDNPIKKAGGQKVPRKPKPVKLDSSFESVDEAVTPGTELRPKRATRGRVPLRFKDTVLSEDEEKEEGEVEVMSVQKGKGRGRPPKYSAQPPPTEHNANPDVTVNIAVKDRSCAQHLDLMGVYILYYCRKCAFSSKQMSDITEHIRVGEHLSQPIEALEGVLMEDQTVETFVSEPLVSEALTDVAQDDLKGIVAKDKIVKTGGKYVKVDEHSYAEVTVEKQMAPTAKGDAQDALEEAAEAEVHAEEIVKMEDDGAMSDDSVADPDFEGDVKAEEEDESDHEIESDDESVEPRKRGRKRRHSEGEMLSFIDENLEENSDLEEDPMVPRRYTCPQCPYIVLYSFNDFKEHRRCHKNASDSSLHCYICQLTGKKRVMAGESWGRIKTHLAGLHAIDFQLPCPLCPAVLSQHAIFVRHYKSHLNSCKYDFCRYDTAVEGDMRLHTQCHLSTNPRHFRCPLCNFSSKLKPWKWPVMHYHLVVKHPGSILANFTCKACGAGFFDTGTYIDHKTVCGKEEFTCDLCKVDIPKASLVRHAVWHTRKDEGLIPPDEKFVVKSDLRSNDLTERTETEEYERNDSPQQEHEPIGEHADKARLEDSQERTGDASHSTTEEPQPETSGEADGSKENPVPPLSASQVPEKIEVKGQVQSQVSVTSQPEEKDLNVRTTKDTQQSKGNEGDYGEAQEEFRCIEHEETFDSQAALTTHYIQVHWGLTEQRLGAARKEVELRLRDREERAFPTPEDNDVMQRVERMRRSTRSGFSERCQYCYKTFASTPRLLRHLSRCHTEEKLKPLPCSECNKLFRNRVQLRNHYRVVHEGVKRRKPAVPYRPRKRLFICELCGYTTPENIRLKNHHLSAHAGVMPYSCDVCQYKTNEKSDLRRHVAKHEGRKRHMCDYCDYKTDQRWLLVNHCLRQHNVQLPKHNRDTRGTTFGSKRKEQQEEPQIEQVIVEGGDEISLETLENLVQLQAVQNGEEVTIWMTTPEEYEAATNMGKGSEQVLAVESLGDRGERETPQVVYVTEQEQDKEGTEAQQIVYVREDGTIVSADELMTIAVEGEEYGQQMEQALVVEPQTLQVQEIAGVTEEGEVIIQEH